MQTKAIKLLTKVNDKRLYVELYQNYPKKPTIVFLHDSLGCVKLWRDFPHKLAEVTQCNVLIYDRLGYGRSEPMSTHKRPTNYLELEADILNDLLNNLNIDNIILFGHSDGGSIALIAASKYPKKINGLICEAGHVFVEDLTLKGIYEAIKAYESTNLPERLAKYHNNNVDTIFKAWSETWTRNDYRNWNIEHFLPKIICPLLFIQGESDEYGTLAQVEKTINQISGKSEKFIIPNIGHSPHKEAPKNVLDKVIDYIECLKK
jgi:pimeloyl-ACP methyl ester carboxylesterase